LAFNILKDYFISDFCC